MKKYPRYFIVLSFLLLPFSWSCEKDSQNDDRLDQDEIIFQSYNPAIELKSYQTRTLGHSLMDSVFGFIHFEMFDYFGIRILDHGLNNKPQGKISCGQQE